MGEVEGLGCFRMFKSVSMEYISGFSPRTSSIDELDSLLSELF